MTTSAPGGRGGMVGALFVGAFAIIAAVLFAAIYLALPESSHFYSLVGIGILALVFALGAYLAQALTPDPAIARALSWGFAGLGFALLIGTLLLNPGAVLSTVGQLLLLVMVGLILLGTLAGAAWRFRTVATETARQERRVGWQTNPPPSALDYKAAQHERDVTAPAQSKDPP